MADAGGDGRRAGLFLPRRVASEGEVVVLYNGHKDMDFVKLTRGEVLHSRVGRFVHEDIIGVEFGRWVQPKYPNKLQSKKKRGRRSDNSNRFQVGGGATLLAVTPELWSVSLDRRTQITFPLDNSLVVAHLHLKPGQTVVESGTGSGALTTFLARAVGSEGQVRTFEYNEQRFEAAVKDFASLGIDDVVICRQRNVYTDGFGEELDGKADALFLDVPQPWLAVPHAERALKPFGRICTFSPCIEQVQETVKVMSERGFSHVLTVECLLRESRMFTLRQSLPACLATEAEIASAESNERYMISMDHEKSLFGVGTESTSSTSQTGKADADAKDVNDAKDDDTDGPSSKRRKLETIEFDKNGHVEYPKWCKRQLQEKELTVQRTVCEPFDRIAGHTGYLTFAYAPI